MQNILITGGSGLVGQHLTNLLLEKGYGEIQTKIKPLKKFYVAEEYHQDYIRKNPNGYCPDHSTGVVFDKTNLETIDNSSLLKGLVILAVKVKGKLYLCFIPKELKNPFVQKIILSVLIVLFLNLQ